jgi:signal transduction histidine kinase/DNA-binding response OmpR family regulator
MIELGKISVRTPESMNEARRKIFNLAESCYFDEISTTRLTTIFSELVRLGRTSGNRVDIALNLEERNGQNGLSLIFSYREKINLIPDLARFFDFFNLRSPDGGPTTLEAFHYLPDNFPHLTDDFIATQRQKLAQLSREELLEDLQVKNEELRTSTAELLKAKRVAEEATSALQSQVHELDQARRAMLNILEDLDEAKQGAEEATKAKSYFLANMSHELRTPMNAILGYSEMLMEDAEDQGQEDFIPDLQKIHAAGKHLLGLINEILDLSKIEAGKMDLFLESFDVAGMINEVASTLRPLVDKNANTLQVHLAPDLGAMHADLTKVRQSLFNLLSNASKFTENGTITLDAEPVFKDGDRWIAFRVADTGIGMTPEQLDKLFQPFVQADTSTSRKYGGTGLGMTITQLFVKMMGGEMSVASEPGAGTTFTVLLPTEVKAPPPAEVPQPEAAEPIFLPGANTVLVIEDDPGARDLLTRFLTKEGYRVETASGGQAGLRLARELHPDIITLDVMMPDMDGWAVLGVLKADPELADIPVVMLTIVDNKNLGYALGAADYLTKPIQRDRLLAVLAKYCPPSQPATVLVVEDDSATREVIRHLLQKTGVQVAEAENGRVALERLAESQPGLILLDLMMPEMDGFQFVDHVRQHEAWRAIPIVVVTAKDLTAEDRLRLNGYVTDIISKDTRDQEELLAEVSKMVKTRLQKGTVKSGNGSA